MIRIIDYKIGNVMSIHNMFKKLGLESKVTSDLKEIREAKKLILPGVGAFDYAMSELNKNHQLKSLICKKVLEDRVPILGICLGMQLLLDSSEEGKLGGFGFIKGTVKKISTNNKTLKVPHMGWNNIKINIKSKLTDGLNNESKFYFVHSYAVHCNNSRNVLCTTNHGGEFDSVINHQNIYGTQFHPEKSHKFGLKLLQNFSKV